MGLFTRKKRPAIARSTSATSPTPSCATCVSTSPKHSASSTVPVVPGHPTPGNASIYTCEKHTRPRVSLVVALDPPPKDARFASFDVGVELDGTVADLRAAIGQHLGTTDFSLFKVAIPVAACEQATEYRARHGVHADLVSVFSSFSMDDPRQLRPSLGLTWTPVARESSQAPKISDWFPDDPHADMISVLVRPATVPTPLAHDLPITILAHFASEGLATCSRRRQVPPTVVSIHPSQTVLELKKALLVADGREVVEPLIDGIVVWQVEMSREEMIIIGERGGLKNGRMPWPYPPGGAVPKLLADSSAPVSRYLPSATSNAQMVTFSVWLDSLAESAMPRRAQASEAFTYCEPRALVSGTTTETTPRRPQQRASTAPSFAPESAETVSPLTRQNVQRAIQATTPTRPRFGHSISSSAVVTIPKGLGISVPRTNSGPITRASLSSSSSGATDSVPELSFSQKSLNSRYELIQTPPVESQSSVTWLSADETRKPIKVGAVQW